MFQLMGEKSSDHARDLPLDQLTPKYINVTFRDRKVEQIQIELFLE